MWDFRIGRSLFVLLRTWPFIVLRLVVYFAALFAYAGAVGAGAGIGWGLGHVFGPDGPVLLGLAGGVLGFGFVWAVLYWLREYSLYLVKAGHIAAMVHLIDGHAVPGGAGQVGYAHAVVKRRFAEASAFFVVDQLVKGAIRAVATLIGGFAALLRVPGLGGLVSLLNAVVRLSVTYVDELVLGYNIRQHSASPFETARQGVVLYAQNGMAMVKNAVWLALIQWGLVVAIFVVMLAPAGSLVYLMPGQSSGWVFVLALFLAWAVKAAVIEPFAIACLMQVYFARIEGQLPDPEWDRKLSQASEQFRKLKERAAQGWGGEAPGWRPSAA